MCSLLFPVSACGPVDALMHDSFLVFSPQASVCACSAECLVRVVVVFSHVQSRDRLGCRGNIRRRFSRDLLAVFCARRPCEQFWHGQGCSLFDVAHPAFPLSTTASPTLRDARKDGFGLLTPCITSTSKGLGTECERRQP